MLFQIIIRRGIPIYEIDEYKIDQVKEGKAESAASSNSRDTPKGLQRTQCENCWAFLPPSTWDRSASPEKMLAVLVFL